MNIKVFVLDTQVYSNTGGQASTSSFTGQNTKMSVHGKAIGGKQERRKEIAQIAMMHPRTYVAQTTCAHTNHFYRSVLGALEFDGPAIVVCYTTCQPEHGVGDNMAADQARLAVDSRAFPLLVYDPRKGNTIKERLSLQGNPAAKDDWYVNPKTKEAVTFIDFARSEGRFSKHFDRDGNPSETLLAGQGRPARELASPPGAGGPEVIWRIDRRMGRHEYRHASGSPITTRPEAWPRPGIPQAHPLRSCGSSARFALWQGSSARLRRQSRRLRDRRPGLSRPRRHPPAQQHQHRLRPADDPPADQRRVQGIQARPLPSLGRGSGDVKAARRLQASGSGAAIRTSVNEDGSGTVAKAAAPISSWTTVVE